MALCTRRSLCRWAPKARSKVVQRFEAVARTTHVLVVGITAEQMALPPIDCKILLANTYHLALRPGTDLLKGTTYTASSRLNSYCIHILQGLLRIKSADFASDGGPLDATCACFVCTEYSRAYLHHVMKKDGSIGPQLITYHNVAYMLHLMAQVRQAILNDSFPSFVRAFMAEWHQGTPVPAWVHDALNYVGIPLNQAE
ncbi:hypothetical protein DYB36_003361 [Aphanomyces astaci]|uniref:tRNA-guanine(15) transglycosylase-like domain-containing protein n=1 Tax=Aphanomyces astaci TaxID=112090 RepID=A0A397AEE1_APHAT|nr:hypothetical protein DYB36_003361 [Aphanomyces astaci]